MIIRANIRSNGGQLGWYLVSMRENEHVEILEADGREEADSDYLRQVVMSMEYNCELTKGKNPFFNVQINPAYGEDQEMTREDWYKAADMLAEATGYENQRRVIVLHTKKGRTHAHVVWERYNHETGKLIDNKNSIYKTNDVRPKIEAALGHKQTPHRNPHQLDIKITMTKLWNETQSGAEFLKATRKAGFIVSSGTGNRPFMVVNEHGRSFNLIRQIEGIRTKDMRARLRHETLMTDKEAIEIMRNEQSDTGKRDKQKIDHRPTAIIAAKDFAANRFDTTQEKAEAKRQKEIAGLNTDTKTNAFTITQAEPPKRIPEKSAKHLAAEAFAENRDVALEKEAERQAKLQRIVDEQERIKQRSQQKKPRR